MLNSSTSYPIEVGEQYETEFGVYEVLDIEGPDVTIEYEDGERQTVGIELLTRIWERIQLEEEITAQRKKRKQARRSGGSRSRNSYGRDFEGLSAGDFGVDLTGTSWRRREELGGLLAERLSSMSGKIFESHAVPRRPQVHIVYPEHYEQKVRVAKFIFDLSGESAFYGFYIEKPDEPLDESWDWVRFLPALAEDRNLHAHILVAMQRSELQWTIGVEKQEDRYISAQDETLYLESKQEEGAESERTPIDWDGFVELLNEIPSDTYCNLYLTAEMSADRAIELGVGIANEVVVVFDALLPLYEASVGED
jgi:hypothetical protein